MKGNSMGNHPFEVKLYQNLSGFFEENHFALLLDLHQFRRKTTTGFDNVIFSVSPYLDEFWLDVNFGVRHDAIEQTAQQFLSNRLDFRPDANTLLTTIGRFRQRNYFRYKIHNEIQFDEACGDIRHFFTEKGFGFFDLVRSLPELDLIINEFPQKRCPYIYNTVHRCFKGLVTARLAENPRLPALYYSYRDELANNLTDAATLAAFERLRTFLNYYSSN